MYPPVPMGSPIALDIQAVFWDAIKLVTERGWRLGEFSPLFLSRTAGHTDV